MVTDIVKLIGRNQPSPIKCREVRLYIQRILTSLANEIRAPRYPIHLGKPNVTVLGSQSQELENQPIVQSHGILLVDTR